MNKDVFIGALMEWDEITEARANDTPKDIENDTNEDNLVPSPTTIEVQEPSPHVEHQATDHEVVVHEEEDTKIIGYKCFHCHFFCEQNILRPRLVPVCPSWTNFNENHFLLVIASFYLSYVTCNFLSIVNM